MAINKIFKGEQLTIFGTLTKDGVDISSPEMGVLVYRDGRLLTKLPLTCSDGLYSVEIDTSKIVGHVALRFVLDDESDGSHAVANKDLELVINDNYTTDSSDGDSWSSGFAGGGSGNMVVDVSLSLISTNPVQNWVVTSALDEKAPLHHIHDTSDFTPALIDALKGDKGDAFTFDDLTEEQIAELGIRINELEPMGEEEIKAICN